MFTLTVEVNSSDKFHLRPFLPYKKAFIRTVGLCSYKRYSFHTANRQN